MWSISQHSVTAAQAIPHHLEGEVLTRPGQPPYCICVCREPTEKRMNKTVQSIRHILCLFLCTCMHVCVSSPANVSVLLPQSACLRIDVGWYSWPYSVLIVNTSLLIHSCLASHVKKTGTEDGHCIVNERRMQTCKKREMPKTTLRWVPSFLETSS